MIHLDTHVVAWLYDGKLEFFPQTALDLLRGEPPSVSPIVDLELQYLHEIGRLRVPSPVILKHLESSCGLTIADTPFSRVVEVARDIRWTRDPFDRLIVGQALAEGASLLTRDQAILENCGIAVWN